MVKALGLNTISSYIFWNFHQTHELNAPLDFTSEAKNLHRFISLIKKEQMYMLIRPGPYVCGEWDAGGLPHWLLQYNMRIRCMDEIFLQKVEKYIEAVAHEIRDLQITNGGPIIMLQIENEYGSYGSDHAYLKKLELMWRKHGITVPFYTADGAWIASWKDALESGSVFDGVLGIDPGVSDDSWEAVKPLADIRKVPVFSSETYPGWMTHWGEDWKGKSTEDTIKEIDYLLKRGKSFNLYMLHGGTNFGFWAGANYDEKNGFQPQITSYDYDAPINEQGAATEKYHKIKELIQMYHNTTIALAIPEPIPIITFEECNMTIYASIWENLSHKYKQTQPKPMEYFDQSSGLIIYRNKLGNGPLNGALKVRELHDIGSIYVDDILVGTIDRMVDPLKEIEISNATNNSVLEILVMAMGRINFGSDMLDNKGITNYVTLGEIRLMQWDIFSIDLNEKYIKNLAPLKENKNKGKPGLFYKGNFNVEIIGDTYVDLSKYQMGVIWVNGYNLGRFWSSKGPQKNLYCPGAYLKKGDNEVLILDLYQLEEKSIQGLEKLN